MSGTLQASIVKDSASATSNLTLDASGNVTVGNNLTVTGSTTVSATSIGNLTYTGTLTGSTGIMNIGSGQIYKNASGNVGFGITPSAWSGYTILQTAGPSMWGTTGVGHLSVNTYFDGTNYKYINTDAAMDYYQLSGTHVWRYAASGTAGTTCTFSEAMRTDSSGNLLVGTTSQILSGKVSISGIASSGFGPLSMSSPSFPSRTWSTGPDFGGSYVVFNASAAGVYIAYGGTAWTTTSDERLKTDLIPIENAASKVSTLRAVTGRFKTDEEGTSRSFLIAQDVQAVLPEAVDATNPDKLGVQYTEVIPLLVAAIKELSAKNDALEARLSQLEAK